MSDDLIDRAKYLEGRYMRQKWQGVTEAVRALNDALVGLAETGVVMEEIVTAFKARDEPKWWNKHEAPAMAIKSINGKYDGHNLIAKDDRIDE